MFEACSEGQTWSLCGQCHTALADLISCSQALGRGESREIMVPYFGGVEITRKEEDASLSSLRIPPNDRVVQTTSTMTNPTPTSLVSDEHGNDIFPALIVADDVFFSYHGFWESHRQEPCWPNGSLEAGLDPTNAVLDYYLAPEFPM